MKIFKKFIYLLSSQERKQGFLLLIMIIVMGLLEVAGVASIMPFTAILINPEIIDTNSILRLMFDYSNNFGIQTKKHFMFILGLLVFVLLLASILFKAVTHYFQLRYTNMREYSISKNLIERYLHQPYSWFLNRHSANLGKSILSEVGLIIGHGLQPLMELIAKSFVALTLIILLIIVDYKIAIVSGFVLATAYILVYKFTRSYLSKIGQDRANANEARFTIVNEAFGAAKELKVAGLEKHYIKYFAGPAKVYSKNVANASIVGGLPRYVLEILVFGGMLLIILYLMTKSGSFVNIVPIIALYAAVCYRLIPALQSIYAATTQLRFISPALDQIYQDFKSLKQIKILKDDNMFTLNQSIT